MKKNWYQLVKEHKTLDKCFQEENNKKPEERIKTITKTMQELEKYYKDQIPKEELHRVLKDEKGLTTKQIQEGIKKMKEKGDIYEPRSTKYQLI